MSKTKEIDDIAQGIMEVTLELMNDSVDWQLEDFLLDGIDYKDLHAEVLRLSIEKMYIYTRMW